MCAHECVCESYILIRTPTYKKQILNMSMQTPNIWDKHRTVKYEDHFETVFTPLDCTMEKKQIQVFFGIKSKNQSVKKQKQLT